MWVLQFTVVQWVLLNQCLVRVSVGGWSWKTIASECLHMLSSLVVLCIYEMRGRGHVGVAGCIGIAAVPCPVNGVVNFQLYHNLEAAYILSYLHLTLLRANSLCVPCSILTAQREGAKECDVGRA